LRFSIKQKTHKTTFLVPDGNVNIDVAEINGETSRVAAPENHDPVKVINLSKTYPNGFLAVKDISVGVEKKKFLVYLGQMALENPQHLIF